MKRMLVFLLVCFVVTPVFAKTLKCQVDNMIKKGSRKKVPVNIRIGTEIIKIKKLSFEGHSLSVVFDKGDSHEPQNSILMTLNKIESRVRDPNPKSAYELSLKNIRFQCWFE